MTPVGRALSYTPPLLALTGILTAILISKDWNPLRNAISDLGVPAHNLATAIVLNVTFALSSYLLIIAHY